MAEVIGIRFKDKDGIQENVQSRAAGNTDHAGESAALKAQLVVQNQRGGHPGGADEDDAQIAFGIGKDGICRAEEIGQRLQKKKAQQTERDLSGTRKHGNSSTKKKGAARRKG